jgi:hypothetical protein
MFLAYHVMTIGVIWITHNNCSDGIAFMYSEMLGRLIVHHAQMILSVAVTFSCGTLLHSQSIKINRCLLVGEFGLRCTGLKEGFRIWLKSTRSCDTFQCRN